MVDEDYVLFLVVDSIYIDIKITSCSGGNSGGGFTYTRATKNKPVTNRAIGAFVGIECFPNPLENMVNIQTKELIQKVIIRDALGKEVVNWENPAESNTYSAQISTKHLQQGVYFVFVNDEKPLKVVKN